MWPRRRGAAGALLGYFVARLAYKHLRKRLRTLRQERKPPKKKMGTMDRILVLEAVFLVAYTVADLVVFWHTGSEPATFNGLFGHHVKGFALHLPGGRVVDHPGPEMPTLMTHPVPARGRRRP